ncbi:MAG: sugar transferase [Propionibacteriaceae bacterium]|nr:sugar transferase [Propionibacteriaceae bacterium]
MTQDHRGFDFSKRLFDVVVSGVGLVVLSPVMAATALLVRHHLGSPVMFSQDRPGKNAKVFRLYKFRSMHHEDANSGLTTDEERLTSFGRKLRATSLDELPTLWNVLKGDMSIVGPRPLLVEYLPLYSSKQARRHEVRPGITGLAQVRGRNALSWEEKFKCDVEYIDSRSWGLDLSIIARTMSIVAKRQGISEVGQATMNVFQGAHHD